MKKRHNIQGALQSDEQRGMTLLEIMVTLGVFSIFVMGTLQFYSATYKHLRIRESAFDVMHDAQHIMSAIGQDIRQAEEVVENYQELPARSVITAFKIAPTLSLYSGQTMIVYWLDETRPTHLFRSVYKNGQESSLELSPFIQSLTIQPEGDRLLNVQLALQDTVAGQLTTFQASSTYAMRF